MHATVQIRQMNKNKTTYAFNFVGNCHKTHKYRKSDQRIKSMQHQLKKKLLVLISIMHIV